MMVNAIRNNDVICNNTLVNKTGGISECKGETTKGGRERMENRAQSLY
jgi:hypothetical protein